MPMFDFKCPVCGSAFEEFLRPSDPINDVECPECGSARVERQLSAFAVHGGKPIGAYRDSSFS